MGTFQVPGRISGQTYNLKIKGDTPSPTEQARIRAFVEEKENSFAADYEARYGAPLTVDDGTAIGRGFELGKAGAYSRLGTATEYLGSGLGLESLADFGRGMRESGDQETFLETLRQPAPTQLKDVKGLGSFLTYAGEGIGQSGPEMLAPLAATGIGTLVGGPVAGVGAGAATAFPSFFGGNIQRQEQEVAAGRKDKIDVTDAVISAVGQSALNSIGDKLLLGGFLKPGQKWLTRTAVGAGEGAAAEIPTEITQQIIERKQAGLPLDDDEAINEYINAGVLGGIMGGGVRATTAGLGLGMEKETPPPPPTLLLPPPALITPPPGTPPSKPTGTASPTVEDIPEAEIIPDEAYAEDAKAGAGTYTQEDLADARSVYDEVLANEQAKGANPDEAERIAASSTLDYIDTLPEDTKQRLSRFRATMARFASIPASLPDEAYSEFSAPEPDLFTAAPTVTLDAKPAAATGVETDVEAFGQADAEAAAAGTGVTAKLKAINDEAARKQAEAAATLKAQAEAAAKLQAEAAPEAEVPRVNEAITDIASAWDAQNRNNRSDSWFEGKITAGKAFDAIQKEGNFIPAHGMSKVATLSEGLQNLTTLLDGGIDPNRTLYTAPLTAVPGSSSTTPGGYAYRDGPFIVTFRQGLAGPPTSADITGVLVNPAHAEIATELQTKYPNLTIRTFDAVADVVAASKSAAPTAAPQAAPKVIPLSERVLTAELVDMLLGVGKQPQAALRKRVGQPINDPADPNKTTTTIKLLNSVAQSSARTPEQRQLAADLITGAYFKRLAESQATAQEATNDGQGAAVDPTEAGASVSGGTQGVGEGQGAASDGQAAEIATTSGTGGLASDMQSPVAAGATGGTEPNTLAELEAQLDAARDEAEVARKKVPPGLLERKPVGGAVDPALQEAVTNLNNVLARQELALETAKNKFNLTKVPGEVRNERLKAYTDAIAKVDATRKQLAEAQVLLSGAELKAGLSRDVQPLAQPDAKGQVALTNYTKALNKADALAKRVETARARQVEEAQAPVLPTGLRDPVVPDTFMTFQRGFTTKPIAPADAPRSAAESVRAENILRRLTEGFFERTTLAYRKFTGGRRGINSESSWETNPDWVPLDDQIKVLALLGRVDIPEEFGIAKDELEPGEVLLTKEERAARVYFSKTIRPVDAIAMMVQDLTVGYKKYRVSEDVVTIKGIGNVESLLSQGTGSVPATDALNWVRTNLSAKTKGAVDLSVKKQAEKNKTLEGLVGAEGGTDRVEEQRAKRRAVKAAQAADADTSGYSAMETAAQMAANDSRIALDTDLHYSVKASLDNGDLKGALLALAATTNNAELKTLASRFAELTGTTRVKVLYPGDSARNIGRNKGIYWQYDGNNPNDLERRNIIYLNGQIGMTAHVLTHEVAHALSMDFIETQPNHPIVRQLEDLLLTLRKKVSSSVAGAPGDFYGLRNVKEMVAEAYGRIALGETDNGLRDLMKRVPLTTEVDVEYDNPLTAWERFQEIAANILNMVMGRPLTKRPRTKSIGTKTRYETAATKFHRLFDGILSEAPDVLPDTVLQKAVSSPMVAKNVLNNAIKNAPIWDKAGRKRLSDLMMSSVSVDLRRALLAPLQLEWFNDLAGKYFPQIAALKVIDDLRRGSIRRLENAAAPVLEELAKYAQQNPELYSALMSILPTASRLEVDPTKPQSTYASDPEKLRVWHDLNRQLNTLDTTGEMRKLFKTNIALFASYRKEIQGVLRARVKDLTDDVAMQNQIYKRLMDKLDAEGAIDPYFSLMREGDFWLIYTAEDNTAGAVALDPFGRPKRPTTQYIQAFNSAWARSAFRAKLETTKDADGKPVAWDIKEDRRPKQDRNLRGSVSPAIVQAMFNILDSTVPKTTRDAAAEQRAANARTAIEDLFLSFAPETSILKSLNKRKGTRGFIGDITPIGVVDRPIDMLGALDRKSHAIAFQLSNMKYGAEIQRLMNQVEETHNKLKDSGLSASESVAVEAYRDEFLARAAYAKSPTVSKFWQTNRGLTFGFTLGGNISGMLNNMLQIPAIGVPELAGRYGMREAQRELFFAASTIRHAGKTQQVLSYGPDGRAVREITSIDNYGSFGNYYTPKVKINPQTGEEEFGYDLRTDMNIPAKLQAKLKDMDVLVEVMANNDMLAGSTNQELLDATSDWWRKINRWSGFGMHHTERFNRQTMAIAAYNLELGKRAAGSAAPDYATKLAAAKKAVEITERVNGSIGAAQGSRIGFGGIGSLVVMYKRFGLMMTRYLINNVKQSLKRVTPGMSPAEIEEVKAERAVARYQTIGIIGTAALFSGAQGLPFFGEVTTLIDLLFTDDDEEPAKVVVQKFLGEPYYNGALNYLLGIEIASRVSLSGLIFRENMIDKDQPILYDAIEMFGGPAVGIILNIDRGRKLMEEGELYRGLEAMTPSAIKNLMKAGRFGTEGATTLRGDEIVPLSALDVVKQAIGYTPEAYARQQQRTSVTKRIDEAVREKRTKLLRKYNQAMESKDFAEVREILKDMREFSREYPESAIEASTLSRSLKGFQQRSDEMIGGVSFNQLERARREIGEFDEDTTLWADVVQ